MNMWFTKLIKQFFFWLDKIVFNFIPEIYELLITIARTSVLTQADIADMADRIYKLLAIFMIFKVILSLVTYVVNPDEFSDKSKGVAKLGSNIVISLALLILTPYLFSYAYQIQTIILEDNSLATLVFGGEEGDKEKSSFFNRAGDEMAYTTMSAFFSPNLSLGDLHECTRVTSKNSNGEVVFNSACENALSDIITDDVILKNYVKGVELRNLGLTFRQDLALATDEDNTEFVMEYKFVFSTVVGVVVILLLLNFCMDVAVRSLKLAFLQLMAPVPIISYVDPKSGKDGMFKKWYEMCFKTYLSLFIRLLTLYFAVYIISKVSALNLVDVIDGSYQTSKLVAVFVIIGTLMFAKDLPNLISEITGLKLNGDGKFTLNPLKKFEEGALGGKRITGALGGLIGGIPRGRMLSGAIRGFAGNKGLKGGFDKQADVNRRIGEARMNGAGFWGSRFSGLASKFGMENADMERQTKRINQDKHRIKIAKREMDTTVQSRENEKKGLQDQIKPDQHRAEQMRTVSKKGKALVDFSKSEITSGKADSISTRAKHLENLHAYLEKNQGVRAESDISYYAKGSNGKLGIKTIQAGEYITTAHATEASEALGFYTGKQGAMEHLDIRLQGQQGRQPKMTTDAMGLQAFEYDNYGNIVYEDMESEVAKKYDSAHMDFTAVLESYKRTAQANGYDVDLTNASSADIKKQADSLDSQASIIESQHAKELARIAELEKEISEIREKQTIMYEGEEIPIAEAERRIAVKEQKLEDRRSVRKTNVQAYNDRRLGGGS